jgi:membrane protein YqaA with SNARE-associated domain
MLNLLAQTQRRRTSHSLITTLRHLGAAGLFFLAVLDSAPVPTFGGPDVVTALLAAGRRELWYEYATSATLGSILGAFLTFRVARTAGSAYLDKKFKKGKFTKFMKLFTSWGTGTLIASTVIPLPTPTSMFFAAAGAGDYPQKRFLAIVAICRAVRYFGIAYVAGHYGRHFLRVLRHPLEHWGWLAFFIGLTVVLFAGGILASRRLEAWSAD